MSHVRATDLREEPPEVRALRKWMRGEPLSLEEQAILDERSRLGRQWAATQGTALSQEQVTALLEERRRRGE